MTFERIEALVRGAQGRGLAVLEFGEGGAALRVVFGRAAAGDGTGEPAPTAPCAAPGATTAPAVAPPGIAAPCVGFLRLHHPAGAALPVPGDAVAAGAVVAFVQAGPLLHPVAAPRGGVLGEALAAEGAPVGYATPLFGLA